jgi:uncharacterized protein YerC
MGSNHAEGTKKIVQREEMLPLLNRHEVQVLLRAGHTAEDIKGLTGVSARSIRRSAKRVMSAT